MPVALRLVVVATLGLASLVFACGGDDNGDTTATPTRSPTPSRTSGAASPTDDDQKSPGPDETPDDSEPTPTRDGGPERTPAAEGTRVPVVDAGDFADKYAGETLDPDVRCSFNTATAVVDCADRGLFAPDPVPAGPGVECFLLGLRGSSIGLRCEQQEPLAAIYYEIP